MSSQSHVKRKFSERRTGIASVDKEPDPIVDEVSKEKGAVVHPITLECEVPVNLHVTGSKFPIGVDTKDGLVLGVVHEDINPFQLFIAKIAILGTIALAADIVRIYTSFLIMPSEPNERKR
jgi:hypothetical protein